MKVIMTTDRVGKDVEATIADRCYLLDYVDRHHKITGQQVQGVWKGVSETSFLFEGVDGATLLSMALLAKQFEQDAILIIADDNRAYLATPAKTGVVAHLDLEDIGNWTKVDKAVAHLFDGYTITHSGHYVAAPRHEIERKRLSLMGCEYLEAHMGLGV